MIEKPIFLDELGPRRRVVRPVRRASIMAITGITAILMFISETVGTAQELPTVTKSTGVPFDPSNASRSAGDRTSIERSNRGTITDPAAATQGGQATSASPGQWLIDDIARARAKSKVRKARPNPATTAAPEAAHVESGAALRSPDDTRAGGGEDGPKESTGSIGRPPAVGFGDPASSESRGGSIRTEPEERIPGASARPDAPRGLHDAATNCVEAPVDQAPEGEHWHYRLDREAHRKCWYVRANRHEELRPGMAESGRRLRRRGPPQMPIWVEPVDPAWGWWYWQ
jgi:hypothetical protein